MRNKLFLFTSFLFLSAALSAEQYIYRYNAQTGRPDLVTLIPQNGRDGQCLKGTAGPNPTLYWGNCEMLDTAINYMLIEDNSTFVLLEDNTKLLLEK